MSLSNSLKLSCFPYSISRVANRVVHHLFRRNKRRSMRVNKKHDLLTNNMDSYHYSPSDNELQQLLYI
ncbi:unnamed protein product [Adineta steineri]|uniref:Uncharacterized protein n=1 Tax=Adineta steineri TaxID=433720 RepID=A0A815WH56_9BILA|nr:unnamed protein product [Adineta steineri]CAF1360994.1 unnamed protein product [Adineta steineri]CAF1540776.1 unnamed protein product [Adineta steineri]CAF1600112.1 unnamed protein product [Adineta steineri]